MRNRQSNKPKKDCEFRSHSADRVSQVALVQKIGIVTRHYQ